MSKIQSILISRRYFQLPNAIDWVINHKFNHYKIDITPHYYRFRQFNPSKYKSHRTITLTNGIEAIVEY